MKKVGKKAFILNECKSPYIEQAIFILKDGVSSENRSVILDAEKIVASYMGNSIRHFTKKKSLKPFYTGLIAFLGILAVLSVYLILR